MIVLGSLAIAWTVLVIVVYFEKKSYPRRLYVLLTSFKCLYHNLTFGRQEATARKYVNLARSRQVLDEIMREENNTENGNERMMMMMNETSDEGTINTVERWTNDGIKIYKATNESLPIDATEEKSHATDLKLRERIKLIFCGHCGQLNATKLKLKTEQYSFDPKDDTLWKETSNIMDKFMSYLMVLVTALVYFILVIRFVSHDPKEYHSQNH